MKVDIVLKINDDKTPSVNQEFIFKSKILGYSKWYREFGKGNEDSILISLPKNEIIELRRIKLK